MVWRSAWFVVLVSLLVRVAISAETMQAQAPAAVPAWPTKDGTVTLDNFRFGTGDPTNTDIVAGSATTWPTTCSRWLRPKRVKSGMFSDSVAQKPIIAVSDGTNTGQNSANV